MAEADAHMTVPARRDCAARALAVSMSGSPQRAVGRVLPVSCGSNALARQHSFTCATPLGMAERLCYGFGRCFPSFLRMRSALFVHRAA